MQENTKAANIKSVKTNDKRIIQAKEDVSIVNIYFKFVKENKLLVSGYIFFIMALVIERIIFPHYYGKIIEKISRTTAPNIVNVSKKYIIIVIVLTFISQGMYSFTDYIDSIVIPKMQTYFRDSAVYSIIETFKENYKELEIGDVISKVIKLPITIKDIFHQSKNYIFAALTIAIFTVVYFFMINTKLAFLTLFIIILYVIGLMIIGKDCIPSSLKRDEFHDDLHEQISDAFSNLITIYSFNNTKKEKIRINKFTNMFDNQYTDSLICTMKFKIVYAILYIVMFLCINGYAFYLCYKEEIKVSSLVSILFVVTYLLGDLQSCSEEIKDFLYNLGVLHQSQKYLDGLFNIKNKHISSEKSVKINRIKDGEITLKSVSFKYENAKKYTLDNFDLHIPAKQSIAIMGDIGSGKSTITKLIMRYYNSNGGNIYIDKMDINNISPDSLRQSIAFIPQNTKLFDRSIYENITYGTYKSKKYIIELINKLELNKVFVDVDKLLDKRVGKNGENLSGGQRQIVCFLRVLVNMDKYGLIILDEPTSALDPQSKEYVIKILKLISDKKTCIIICHDDELLKVVDRSIYIKNGKITKDEMTSSNNKMFTSSKNNGSNSTGFNNMNEINTNTLF
jgi:ABC-type multidrug transport system fused ATPase/permease subunit